MPMNFPAAPGAASQAASDKPGRRPFFPRTQEMTMMKTATKLTGEWADVAASEIPDEVQFLTPPNCQGQIVELSYGQSEGVVYMHRVDRSDRSESYAARLIDDDEVIEPWQQEPH